MSLTRAKLTEQFYQQMLEAYRERPGDIPNAARACACSYETAKRGWELGWPKEWARPIAIVIQEEQGAARAARLEMAETERQAILSEHAKLAGDAAKAAQEEYARAHALANAAETANNQALQRLAQAEVEAAALRADTLAQVAVEAAERLKDAEEKAKARFKELTDRAKVDGIETMADEAQSVKLGRKASMSAAAIAALILRDAPAIAETLRKTLEGATLKPLEAMRIARVMVEMVRACNEAIKLSLQNERLYLGQPTEVFGIKMEDVTIEDMQHTARALQAAVDRARSSGAPMPPSDPGEEEPTISAPDSNGVH